MTYDDWRWLGSKEPAPQLAGGAPDLFGALPFPWEESLAAGVDEAGRGALAGPVSVGAVILNADMPIEGLDDSKALSALEREALAEEIRAKALAWCVSWGSARDIERLNILQATVRAMRQAVNTLAVRPSVVLVDGNYTPKGLSMPVTTLVKGDALVAQIAAASILAKTSRDHLMQELDKTYPGYGFATHMGYGTPEHLEALKRLGPCPAHRRTFEPVRSLLAVHESAQY